MTADSPDGAVPHGAVPVGAVPHGAVPHGSTARFVVEPVGAWDHAHAVGLLAAHSVPGAEATDVAAATHARLVELGTGAERASHRLDLSFAATGVDVTVTGPDGVPPTEATVDEARRVVRTWLDLDTDLDDVERGFADDPVLGPLVAARPGIRVTGNPDGFETAVMTVLGQQVSLAAARTFTGRLVAAHGEPVAGTGLTRFPRADCLAAADVDELRAAVGVTNSRARTIHALAEVVADGLVIAPDVDHADARRRLLAVPGIGPWTVEYLAVRALGDRDAWPAGDLVLRRVMGGLTTKEAEVAGAPWSPWRAYALFHLWAAVLPTAP
ncbi:MULTISPECIES: DNA-3-methyladenine glycosylase 2 [unclassified Frigoribacterium]|uniref:DNA-3-methyladenine glycosylase family protein n=1 Tax=unclassified Frigoribacterium TaxID=2627005 RepID=UPI001564D001|nr:DNA-3-methyladenine glycosylase 2 [Frigoribacterium sp. VKM Ac-2860]NQX08048.1 DNA-3-methyladenine glycosylase 2 [Frigoribacterium sp. VKM Ac-2859]